MELEFNGQIFEKYSNIQFNKNPCIASRVVGCGQRDVTDRHEKADSRFSQFCERA